VYNKRVKIMLEERIIAIKERIACACKKVNRNPDSVTVVAVSKGRGIESIEAVVNAGISIIGENRVQEATEKYRVLRTPYSVLLTLQWHMVGHLQTNKAGHAVKIFDLIHSVDSVTLAHELDTQARRINKIQDVLVEVKTSPEATKFGIMPEKLTESVKEIGLLENIRVKGLMTIAPVAADPQVARPYFKQLRELRNFVNSELGTSHSELKILSMGMSDDFEVAIEEGATMVRLGRAIFEG
jgi:PLP dependent protein